MLTNHTGIITNVWGSKMTPASVFVIIGILFEEEETAN